MKIPTGKGLMFYFGGINIILKIMKEIESSHLEDETLSLSLIPEAYDKKKIEIIKALNQQADVSNVSNLFTQTESPVTFNPIIADMRIPFPIQRKTYEHMTGAKAKVEKFKIIYDGSTLFVVALCPLNERPHGVYDARDRFMDILKPVCEFKETAPCLTHETIVLARKGDDVSKNTMDLYVEVNPSSSILDLIRFLYLKLGPDIGSFYGLCSYTYSIEDSVMEIQKHQSELLSILEEFLTTSWRSIRKRGSLMKQGKHKMLNILKKLSEYTSLTTKHVESRNMFNERLKHNALLSNFIKKIDLDEYAKPEITQDTESSMRIIEHVRSEMETYSISKSTTISALLGAIIGSILTLLATKL